MNDQKLELIAFRLSKADEAFHMASIAATSNYLSSAVSELYYTCFYLVTALVAKHDIKASTHSGVKSLFGSRFINEGLIELKWGKLMTNLFDLRQQGDYGDFRTFRIEEVKPLFKDVNEFMQEIKKIIAA